MAESRLLLASSVLFFMVFIIHGGSNSPIIWIASAFQPYQLIQYPFAFLGAFIFTFALWMNWRLSLILSTLALVAYIILTTGWLL